jgi:uncharacterized protein YodC (DUF2158 family)
MAVFKKGDVVQLKSGGPRMTVTGYSELGNVICRWFSSGKSTEETFPDDALNLVRDDE